MQNESSLPIKTSVKKVGLEDLDWARFLHYTADEARTPYGKERILKLFDPQNFATTPERAQELQNETHEVYAIIDREALWGPLRGLGEIHEALESLEKGGVLEVESLARIRAWLYCFDAWGHFPKEFAGKTFKQALVNLFNPSECLRALDRVLTPTGELSDKASTKLQSILSQSRDLKREISSRMETLLRDYAHRCFARKSV